MSGNLLDIDTSDAQELSEGFVAIPPGEYPMYIESSDRKPTSNGAGEYLECTLIVASGEYEGAKIFARFNLWNQNQQAVDIAKSQWRALCEATLGQPNAINNDSGSLHNKMFMAQVANVPAYDKATKQDHPTRRTNEIVFRKGTVRSMQQAALTDAVDAGIKKATTVQAQGHANPPKGTAGTGGTGKPPWKK